MELSPQEIREVRFRERLRGYSPEDVDSFVERMAELVEALQAQVRRASDRAERPEADAAHEGVSEKSAANTLQLAQRAAELVLKEAEAEASRLIREAEERARATVLEAEQRAVGVVDDSRAALQLEVSRLELTRDRLREEVAALDRYVEEERARAQRCLTEAAVRLTTAVPGLSKPSLAASDDERAVEVGVRSGSGDVSDMSPGAFANPSLAPAD